MTKGALAAAAPALVFANAHAAILVVAMLVVAACWVLADDARTARLATLLDAGATRRRRRSRTPTSPAQVPDATRTAIARPSADPPRTAGA